MSSLPEIFVPWPIASSDLNRLLFVASFPQFGILHGLEFNRNKCRLVGFLCCDRIGRLRRLKKHTECGKAWKTDFGYMWVAD